MSTSPLAVSDDRQLLQGLVEEAYHRSTWNDTNLRSALKGVSVREAAWHPPQSLRNIAEIVLHCAYWKNSVRRSLQGERKHTFPLTGKDWFAATPLSDEQWSQYLGILDDEHQKLSEAVLQSEKDLRYGTESSHELARKVFGIAMHDAYHTGQIHLVRAMYGRSGEA